MQIKLIEYMSEPQRRFFQAQSRFVGYGGAGRSERKRS